MNGIPKNWSMCGQKYFYLRYVKFMELHDGHLHKQLTPESRVLLKKLEVSQLIKKPPNFMQHKISLPYGEQPLILSHMNPI
jgi:hypothetical protein